MSRLRSKSPPLATASYIHRLIALRAIFAELAWTGQLTQLAHLIRCEDIPHLSQRLERPLTAEQDQLLQQEFVERNDLGRVSIPVEKSARPYRLCPAESIWLEGSARPGALPTLRFPVSRWRGPYGLNAWAFCEGRD